MRAALVVIVALVTAAVAGCGGSDDQTLSVGNGQTITVPGDVDGLYGELEALLDQFPYQRWYTTCVQKRVEGAIGPAEAEALSELPESKRERKITEVTAKAKQACEAASDRPVIDPDASKEEFELLRAGYIPAMAELAEAHELTPTQVACVEHGFEAMPDKLLIQMGNGSHRVREGILLSVFRPCAKVK